MATAKSRTRRIACVCAVLVLAVTTMYQVEYIAPSRRIIRVFHQSAALRVTQTVPKKPREFVDDIGVNETTSHTIREPDALEAIRLIVEELRPSVRYTEHRVIGSLSSFPSHKSVCVEMYGEGGQPLRKIVVFIGAGENGCLVKDAAAPRRVFETPDRRLFELLRRSGS